MERSDPVREAAHEIVRELAPEWVVPAELASTQHLVSLQLVEVRDDVLNAGDAASDVARDVVGDRRDHTQCGSALDHLCHGDRAVGKCRMRVAVDGLPGGHFYVLG